ncbi:IclR family transcriptional regulator [Nocardia sp. NBC_00565]|uniref:IclR family transcriptional regulator n=1 Tax=Nocardia sp. NBC_00565 TaxID=2975993 RepID=UPI002E81646B|nr:IclR family transcriptional regulator [Nocardia sp. NBC_00565]WUC06372.1 IclR family transcriptional regulator [Nocardia sp. NBC_00565]
MVSVLRDGGLSGNPEAAGLPPSMVERMTLIMDVFGGPQTRLTLEEVTGRTSLPRSTAHRILEQLVRLRWLEHSASGYGLGPRALGLGGREAGHGALRAAAFPLLHALAVRTEMVVHLAVLDGTDVYYLDKFGGRAAVEVPSRVGGRAPAHCTAVGKAMLAWLPAEQLDIQLQGALDKRTTRSIGDLGVLHHELSRIRTRNGLAFERGECYPQIACVGVAVRGPDGPIGAISIVGDAQAPLERLAPLVANTAHAISEKLLGEDAAQKPRARQDPTPPRTAPSEALGQLLAMGERGEWF